jgi:hypothetical protein
MKIRSQILERTCSNFLKPASGAPARWACNPPASYRPLPRTNLHYAANPPSARRRLRSLFSPHPDPSAHQRANQPDPSARQCTPARYASSVRGNLQVSLRVNFVPENRGIDFARSGKPAFACADSDGTTMLRHRPSTFRTRHSARLIIAQWYSSWRSSLRSVLKAACAAITELHAFPTRRLVEITTQVFSVGEMHIARVVLVSGESLCLSLYYAIIIFVVACCRDVASVGAHGHHRR